MAIYRPDADKERMFSRPRYLIKAGQVVLDDGDLRSAPEGRSLHVAPEFDPDVVPEIEDWFTRHYSMQFANYPVNDPDVANPTAVPCHQGEREGRKEGAGGS